MTTDNIFKNGHKREYPGGQILLYQGEKSRTVYFIKSGFVKVYEISEKGEEKVLLLLSKGDIFPLVWTFGASDSLLYFYEALEDVEISVIQRNEFLQAIHESHEFSIVLLKYFVERTKELMTRVESIEGSSALHKVGQVLSYLSKTHGSIVGKKARRIKPYVTHQLIGQMAGITRETVSLQMKEFQDNNAISKSKDRIVVHTDRVDELLSRND